jgi:16S rRNA (guanine527-N7)-methyltransferase
MIDSLERAAGRPVSRETLERLRDYGALLKDENSHQNLISATTADHIWERHILDSAQLVRFAPRGATWADVGSGAGLPGVVIAALTGGLVTLIEPRRLRAEFLRRVVSELSLSAIVEERKVERVAGQFGAITGRAVAALPRFLGLCSHLSTKKTTWVLPKGRSAESELAEARRAWQGVFHVERSVTDVDSRIIVATGVRARSR